MKTGIKRVAFFSIALLSFALPAAAQSSSSGCDSGGCHTGHYKSHGVRFVSPSHYGYGPVYRVGYRRYGYDPRFGTAEIIRAQAQSNLINAHARTEHLHADRLQMENSVEFLATRLERKRINKETRFGHLHARGQQVREEKRLIAETLAVQTPPQRSVDPATGRVAWPILLRTSYYEKARGPIDLVFHQRTINGSINPDHFLPMRDWIEQIERELKANVAYYEMEDYLEAKAFLRSLLDEARHDLPIDVTTRLASNE